MAMSNMPPIMQWMMIASLLGGCSRPSVPKSRSTVKMDDFALTAAAKAGVDDQALQRILVQHWERKMRESPVWAGTLGDHRFDGRLRDHSAEAYRRRQVANVTLLGRLGELPTQHLRSPDRITLALFKEEITASVDRLVCVSYQWAVSARGNPISSANVLPDDHPVNDLASAKNLLLRYRQVPQVVTASIANLRSGLNAGRVANAESIRLTIELIKGQLSTPLDDWAISKPVEAVAAFSDEIAADLRSTIAGDIKLAFEAYLEVLEQELLPAGRKGDQIGVHALPDGAACYEASIRAHINRKRGAAEIHALGLSELERINAEMAVVGQKLFGARSLAETIAHLRTSPELYFESESEIVAKAESALARAKSAIPSSFGIVPKADCTVVKIPDFEAPYTTIAYYKQPQAHNNKPGQYFINTYKPKTRPRFEMEVLAFHESIPGHHLQIAISQERHELPLFRRYGGSTAFVEGWALYTERLADEMGLYSSDLDRLGMLSYDAWRASRLVVDTGIHAMKWTREQAETFMTAHTALTESNIRNEVDRYISWPGQAVAYKIGQLEILRLREDARKRLGDKFDLRSFHDVVLKDGAVTLPVLAQQVESWVLSHI